MRRSDGFLACPPEAPVWYAYGPPVDRDRAVIAHHVIDEVAVTSDDPSPECIYADFQHLATAG